MNMQITLLTGVPNDEVGSLLDFHHDFWIFLLNRMSLESFCVIVRPYLFLKSNQDSSPKLAGDSRGSCWRNSCCTCCFLQSIRNRLIINFVAFNETRQCFATLFDLWGRYAEAIRYISSRTVSTIATVRGVATSPRKLCLKGTNCYAFIFKTAKYRCGFELQKPFSFDPYNYGYSHIVALCEENRCAMIRQRLSLPQTVNRSRRQ
ncbi:hypothetical protein MTR_4g050150 [Medicago truncatula]|uniref:Uncharacterized protein n=1 Tax=Medicago truncatula TaxID=3880 RepID=A0A072UV18_MEDTR|nr:hypothetical protein MTR_4g050150 [Medicago truncatula]